MPIINLKIVYSDFYDEDIMLEVSEQIADVFIQSFRNESSYNRKYRRNIEIFFSDTSAEEYIASKTSKYPSLEKTFDIQFDKQRISEAISRLPPKQSRRVYAHYILGMSKAEIARAESVSEASVRESIKSGERKLQGFLKNL